MTKKPTTKVLFDRNGDPIILKNEQYEFRICGHLSSSARTARALASWLNAWADWKDKEYS